MLSSLLQKPVGDYKDLLKQGERIQVEKNTRIVDAETSLGDIYYLEEGIVALTDLMEDGDERVYRYHKRGELLGIFKLYNQIPCLKNSPQHTVCDIYNSVTKTDCVVYRLDPEVVLRFLYQNPEMLIEQIRMTGKVNINHSFRYSRMLKNRTPNILCEVMLEFSRETDGVLQLDPYFSNAEIARYMGIHVVTVGKILKQLKAEKLIDRKDGRIVILDRPGMEAYLGEKTMKYS